MSTACTATLPAFPRLSDAMIVVHHLNNSRSQRVLWLLEELGLPYEIKRYERDPKTMLAPKALRDIHPLGKSPVVVDGDLVLAESGAIVEYLIERPCCSSWSSCAWRRHRCRSSPSPWRACWRAGRRRPSSIPS
jgi:glutathione S-transferase